jgi:multidrug efflux pump subunit AcrA (membrane-fusion protein)
MSRDARLGRRATALLASLAATASLSACTEVIPVEQEHYSPSAISPVQGEKDLVSVTLTREGAERIGLATGVVRGIAGPNKSIPYAALLYEKDGTAFVYTNPQGRTYVRAPIEIDRVAGDRVLLADGPPAGTKVVTTGAPQVHGAELEYGEY